MLLHDDIAGQHRADLVLKFERAISELRIACAKYPIGTKILAELRFERRLEVDIGKDAEAFEVQHLDHAGNGVAEGKVERFREMMGHILP
jgi:hypothetical protein